MTSISLFSAKVCLSSDFTFPLPLMGTHSALLVPPGLSVPVFSHLEFPWQNKSPTDIPFFGKNKFSQPVTIVKAVTHKGMHLMLEGHDVGRLLPHINMPPVPTNVNIAPIIVMMSFRTVNFTASTSKANGKAIASGQMLPIPLPMMTCWDPVALPNTMIPLAVINTVSVGFSLSDVLAGILMIVISVVVDLIINTIFNRLDMILDKLSIIKAFLKKIPGMLAKMFKSVLRQAEHYAGTSAKFTRKFISEAVSAVQGQVLGGYTARGMFNQSKKAAVAGMKSEGATIKTAFKQQFSTEGENIAKQSIENLVREEIQLVAVRVVRTSTTEHIKFQTKVKLNEKYAELQAEYAHERDEKLLEEMLKEHDGQDAAQREADKMQWGSQSGPETKLDPESGDWRSPTDTIDDVAPTWGPRL